MSIAAPQVRQYFVQANKAKRASTNKMDRVMVRALVLPTQNKVYNFSIYKQKIKKVYDYKIVKNIIIHKLWRMEKDTTPSPKFNKQM